MEQSKEKKQIQEAYLLKDTSYIDSQSMRLNIYLPGNESDYTFTYYDISKKDDDNNTYNAIFVHINDGSSNGFGNTSNSISHELIFSKIEKGVNKYPNNTSFDPSRGNGDTLIIVFHDETTNVSQVHEYIDYYYAGNNGISSRFNFIVNNSYRAYREDIFKIVKGKKDDNPKKAGLSIIKKL